jgi:hypothetical protein
MKRRIVSALLVLVVLIGMIPHSVYAATEVEPVHTIQLEDGYYIEVKTEMSPARVANTVSGSKTYTCHGSDGSVMWVAKLSATFAYSGGWYTCTAGNCNVTIKDNQWYVISNSTVRSSNNAVTNLTMGRRTAGVTVERPQYTIRLTCDNNGNLS